MQTGFLFAMKGKIIAFLLVLVVVYASYTKSKEAANMEMTSSEIMVVLDAGHGGADPGKVAVNGALEKEINLSIVKKLKQILENEGIAVYLTREDDARINESGQQYSNVEDIRDRVEVINEIKPKFVVSIHQNSFSDQTMKGGQVFYYENSEKSKEYAEIIQEEIRKIDTENRRQIKGNTTYYLLKKTEVPTVIVECGFLSNWEEAEKLVQESYQEEIARAIANGIKSCLENTSQIKNGSV